MCGIAGIVRLGTGHAVVGQELARMASMLAHRGPDGAGRVLLEQGQVGLAHTRLSVLDLEHGAQPMAIAQGECWITFNGEIYDHEALRETLEALGHRFRTRSDTEVLLTAYRQWGEACVDRLNGEFAFAIWDAGRKKLFAARDPAGVKPLYFHWNPTRSELTFASENKAILCLPGIPRALNPAYMAGPFLGVYPPTVSVFEGIESLAPGGWLRLDAGGLQTGRYWQPSYGAEPGGAGPMSFEEACEAFREELSRAVRRRCVADVPVHVYLSGGMDSTSIAALMSQGRRSSGQGHAASGPGDVRPTAFTIGFSDQWMDETALAVRIAGSLGLASETLRFTSADLVEGFEQAIWHTEQPIANPNTMAKLALSRHVRARGVKVCLTGEGADELLGGYPYFKQEAIYRLWNQGGEGARKARALWRQFRAMEVRSRGILWTPRFPRSFGARGGRRPHASYLEYRAQVAERGYLTLLNRDRLELRARPSPAELFHQLYRTPELEPLDPFSFSREVAFYQLTGYLIPNLGDRVEMANSVECRTPFLDRKLMEFVNRLPVEHFLDLDHLREKRLLHEAMKGLVPSFMSQVHKHPFLAPGWSDFAATPRGGEMMRELLSGPALRKGGWIDARLIARLRFLWPLLPRGSFLRSQVDLVLGSTLSLQLLQELYVHRLPASEPEFPMQDRAAEPASPPG